MVIQKFIVMSEKGGCRHGIKTDKHITYSIFCILNTNSEIYIRPHFVCFGKFVDIPYVNHFGAINVYEFRTLQIPEPFYFHAVSDSSCLAWSKMSNNIEDFQFSSSFKKKTSVSIKN